MKYTVRNNIISLEVDREMAQCLCWAISIATGTSDIDNIEFNDEQTKGLLKLSSVLWKSATIY